jgi:hypothetical protein
LNRPADIRFHQPVEMDNGRDAGDVNQAVELLPPFTQPPNHGRRRSRRQRDQENEGGEARRDIRPFVDVFDDSLKVKEVVEHHES